MPMPQHHPLRPVTEQEEHTLQRMAKASSERVDVVRRARALLAVAHQQTFPQAAATAGFVEARSVSRLVERFNRQGLAALRIGAGRGRKPTYTSDQQATILTEVQREPDREHDQTATWSLTLLQRRLRQTHLPQISRETIRRTLHDAGYRWQRTRTWCPTGTALRMRKSGTVTVTDPKLWEKND